MTAKTTTERIAATAQRIRREQATLARLQNELKRREREADIRRERALGAVLLRAVRADEDSPARTAAREVAVRLIGAMPDGVRDRFSAEAWMPVGAPEAPTTIDDQDQGEGYE